MEQWKIDGVNLPQLLEELTIPFSTNDTQLDFYSLPCSEKFHSFPLIPNIDCVVPPSAISICPNGSTLRIGARLFGKGVKGQNSAFSVVKDRILDESWEDVKTRGPYLVTCRRRIPRAQPSSTSQAKEERRARSAQHRASAFRAGDRRRGNASDQDTDNSDDESEASDDSDGSGSDSSSDDSDLDSIGEMSSAEESWSEGSDTEDSSEDISDFEEADESEPENSEDELELDEPKKSVSSGSDVKSALNGTSRDDNSVDSDPESLDSCVSFDQIVNDSDSDSDDSDIQSDTSERSLLDPELLAQEEPEPEYPIGIEKAEGDKYCDGCNKQDLSKYLHCLICQDNNFDICFGCERRGRWCFDKKHQMYRMVNQNLAGVASRTNFTIRQELSVYRTDSQDKKTRIFRFRKNYDNMLYDSPPIFHPKHPLVVWAVNGERVLFADFEGNTYFQQKFDSTLSKKGKHFSSIHASQKY